MQAIRSHQSDDKLIPTLEEAAKTEDPADSALYADLANLYGTRWARVMFGYARDDRKPDDLMKTALDYAGKAEACDPNGKPGYFMEYEIRKRFASVYSSFELERQQAPFQRLFNSGGTQFAVGGAIRLVQRHPETWTPRWQSPDQVVDRPAVQLALGCAVAALPHSPVVWRKPPWDKIQATDPASYFPRYKEQYRLAAEALLRYLPNDPNNPRVHCLIAEAMYVAEDHSTLAAEHAARALALDQQLSHAARKLTDLQRKYLQQRMGMRRGD
jgi:hypothetical protein